MDLETNCGVDPNRLRALPSVDRLLKSERLCGWRDRLIHPVRVALINEVLSQFRREMRGSQSEVPSLEGIEAKVERAFDAVLHSGMRRVINATGVVLHTNLGRAPLGELLSRMPAALSGYSDLEWDLAQNSRGDRMFTCERLLRLLLDVEYAVIVNNNAAALFLGLSVWAAQKKVILSRGELVQIGGGFRVPDILACSGALLHEVGTTNMTYPRDFESAITKETGLLLKVHRSNFTVAGHVAEVPLSELVAIGKKHRVPVMMDLGSGLLGTVKHAFHELSVADALRTGVEMVCFSGDKFLGGPQAGILVGEKKYLEPLRRHPLYRALRLGKLDIWSLEQTLLCYVQGKETQTHQLLSIPQNILRTRAEKIARALGAAGIPATSIESVSSPGGGTSPEGEIPTVLVQINASASWARRLSERPVPVIVQLHRDHLWIDPRTLLPGEEDEVVLALQEVAQCSC